MKLINTICFEVIVLMSYASVSEFVNLLDLAVFKHSLGELTGSFNDIINICDSINHVWLEHRQYKYQLY